MAESAERRSHLNLLESSRRLFELDPGADVEAGGGMLLGAGSSRHPTIANAAFRADDGIEPALFLERARDFFAARGRGFAIWARAGVDADRELIAAVEAAGCEQVYSMPEMLLRAPAEQPRPADGVEIRGLETAEEAEAYWRIAAAAYASVGFPSEVFGYYEGLEKMEGDAAALFLARLDGEPVGIAMTLLSHDVAGIYWVGCLERARGRGIGRAVTAAATNRGFELGADVASLQASPMGEPIYRAMGYETIWDYRLYHSPAG